MYGSSSRPSTVGELLDGLRRAAGDHCGVAIDQGARQLQLTGLGNGWAVDQEGQFDQEVNGTVRTPGDRPEGHGGRQEALGVVQVDRVTCSASSAEARKRRRGRDGKGDFGLVSGSRCGSSGTDNSRRMHNGASWANRLRASASVRTAVFYRATLCCSVGTLLTCCVGRSPFCSAGTAPLRNDGRRSTMLCCRSTRLTA
ncbi:unnamed protein product [Closterium sp. NIES-54]